MNPYFNEAIQNDLNEMRNRISSFYSGAGRYGSGAHKNELIEKLGHIIYANALANQYNFEVLKSIPIATTEELENMASGGMMRENSYFSKKLREGLQKIADSTNKQFQGVGRYNSDKHNNVSREERDDIHARAMAAQHNHNVEHMLLANAMLDQRNQNQLKAEKDFLQQQSNAATYFYKAH
ncbi:hypothetical protein [Bartonella jaculi]|uniref:Uncharacterized protein n=1 Tax=Bartonella jaculi TaxID=686226 RepID=A0ABP9N276_9HYPH